MPDLESWLAATLLGEPVRDWLAAAGVALAALAAVAVARRVAMARGAALAGRTRGQLDDLAVGVIGRTLLPLATLPAVYLGSLVLALPGRAALALRSAAILSFLLQLALWGTVALDLWAEGYRRRRLPVDAAGATTVSVLRFVGKLALWSLLFLLALDNLGVDVTALVAGLGVGGIAVALALQNILGDLFASLSIALDQPFVIGDAISVGDVTGTVESIGLKTTRVKSVSGEQVVFANGDLLQSRIRNWRLLAERRVVLAFGVAYGTPADRLERLPGLVRRAVESQDRVRFDRAHLKGLGTHGLEVEAVWFVLTPDYAAHMDRQQAILLALLRALDEEGIELAQPAPAVRIEAPPPQPRAPLPVSP